MTPLHFAAKSGSLEVVDFLVKMNANKDAKTIEYLFLMFPRFPFISLQRGDIL